MKRPTTSALIPLVALLLDGAGRVTLAGESAPAQGKAAAPSPWSVRMADSVISRSPDPRLLDSDKPKWEYTYGLVLKAIFAVGEKTGDRRYFDYGQSYYQQMIAPDGAIATYDLSEYNIDRVNPGRPLFMLKEKTGDPRYGKALATLRMQMKQHPRTKEGGFWHKKRYPYQMWLDGLYMGSPFLAQYAAVFNEPTLFDDVAHQLIVMESHARDPKTGLLYHGYDESRQQKWADPQTGLSKEFWGRAMGWYVMALVDVLDFLPKDHKDRAALLAILDRALSAAARVQDPETGVFWQVLDKGGREGNYRESSASAMFAYAFLKAARLGYADGRFAAIGKKAYEGVVHEFIRVDDHGLVTIEKACQVAGLGGDPNDGTYRDGTYDYYVKEKIRANDPKAVGPFIFASLEYESLRR